MRSPVSLFTEVKEVCNNMAVGYTKMATVVYIAVILLCLVEESSSLTCRRGSSYSTYKYYYCEELCCGSGCCRASSYSYGYKYSSFSALPIFLGVLACCFCRRRRLMQQRRAAMQPRTPDIAVISQSNTTAENTGGPTYPQMPYPPMSYPLQPARPISPPPYSEISDPPPPYPGLPLNNEKKYEDNQDKY